MASGKPTDLYGRPEGWADSIVCTTTEQADFVRKFLRSWSEIWIVKIWAPRLWQNKC